MVSMHNTWQKGAQPTKWAAGLYRNVRHQDAGWSFVKM